MIDLDTITARLDELQAEPEASRARALLIREATAAADLVSRVAAASTATECDDAIAAYAVVGEMLAAYRTKLPE